MVLWHSVVALPKLRSSVPSLFFLTRRNHPKLYFTHTQLIMDVVSDSDTVVTCPHHKNNLKQEGLGRKLQYESIYSNDFTMNNPTGALLCLVSGNYPLHTSSDIVQYSFT